MKQWSTVDKSDWGDGAWMGEPDKAVWIDQATGLDCMIHRAPVTGALCGYVGVPPGHPLHGLDYQQLDVDVHGELTYAAPCQTVEVEAHGLCHVPEPGRPGDVWWFGFDCSHFMDVTPALDARMRGLELSEALPRPRQWGEYRDLGFVTAEVTQLAAQLAAKRGAEP